MVVVGVAPTAAVVGVVAFEEEPSEEDGDIRDVLKSSACLSVLITVVVLERSPEFSESGESGLSVRRLPEAADNPSRLIGCVIVAMIWFMFTANSFVGGCGG